MKAGEEGEPLCCAVLCCLVSTRAHPIFSSDQPLEDKFSDDLPLHNDQNISSPIPSDEDGNHASNYKKRKIDVIVQGSCEKGDKTVSGSNLTNNAQGRTPLVSGPSTPLPDKKLLLFVLDRLQKKDTYGVFSEPVDLEELPDYHEIIEHPMDFGTVKEKLSSGAYTKLEEFEEDIFLISSNAMQYNAPDTVYFRQARSIQELAKKTFENLRQDSDDNNEAEPKIVRRGRPPTKIRKSIDGPFVERTGSESDANLATVIESSSLSTYVSRNGPLAESGFADSSGRVHNDVFTNWLTENKYDRNDETTDSMFKVNSLRHGKKQSVLDQSRRNTYKQSLLSFGGRELSVLTTFDSERKQLMAVGLFSEYSYARSLARFAANLGPLAWRIASKRIVNSLPAEVKFGPGWVGENDLLPQKQYLLPPKENKLSEKLERGYSSDKHSHPRKNGTRGSQIPDSTPSPRQKPNSVPPPDLNVQFQSP
ncbi:hypothetical protein ACFE04_026712 [Oxalis oulophora]